MSFLLILAIWNLRLPSFASQNSVQTITFHGNAETTERAVTEIATLAHLNLGVAGALKRDIVVVDVTNVPVNELLNKLADVEYSSWKKSADSLFLTPDFSKIEKAKETYFSDRANTFQTSIEETKNKNYLGGFALVPKDSDEATSHEFQNPAGDIIPAIAGSIGAETLAKMRPGDRIVYSTSPNSLQRLLPYSALQEINSELTPNLKRLASKVDLEVSFPVTQYGYGLTFNALVYDHKGTVICVQKSYFLTPESYMSKMFAEPAKTTSTTQKPEKPIIVNGPAFILLERSRQSGPQMLAYLPSAAYIAAMSDPIQFDPLTVEGAYICGLGETRHQNVIASLPDSIYSLNGGSSMVLPSQELQKLATDTDLAVTSSDKWLTVKESNPEVARQDRTDRVFLTKILKYAKANNAPDVAVLSKIAVKNHGVPSEIALTYIGLNQPAWFGDLYSQNWLILELYGSLSDIERSEINNGNSISLASLSPAAIEVANKLVYGADYALHFLDDPNKNNSSNLLIDLSNMLTPPFDPQNYSDFLGDPTEIAPEGLSPAGVITGTTSKTPVYEAASDAKKGTVLDISDSVFTDLGVALMLCESNGQQGQGFEMPRITGLKQGERTTLDLKIIIAPNVYAGGTITQDQFQSDAPLITPDNYPKSITDKIPTVKAYLKKMHSPSNDGHRAP